MKRIDKETANEIIHLWNECYGQRMIAFKLGLSESTVVRVLRGQHPHNRERLMNGQRNKLDLACYK